MSSEKLIKAYIPMSETAYYILLSLVNPRHGYGIMQHVVELTSKRISLGAGTLYGSLSKMEKDLLIRFVKEENKRKIYEITDFGRIVLEAEIKRITELYNNSKGAFDDGRLSNQNHN